MSEYLKLSPLDFVPRWLNLCNFKVVHNLEVLAVFSMQCFPVQPLTLAATICNSFAPGTFFEVFVGVRAPRAEMPSKGEVEKQWDFAIFLILNGSSVGVV
jgi:hypothetical protein